MAAEGLEREGWWFIDKDEDERGPHTIDELKMFWYEGDLDGLSQVKLESQPAWTCVADWPALKDMFQALYRGPESGQSKKTLDDPDLTPQEREELIEKQRKKEEKRAKQKLQKQGKMWFNPKKNANVYVEGLPHDAAEEEIAKVFSACGVLRDADDTKQPRIKLYKTDDGLPKGDALISYMMQESVPLAIQVLDQTPLRLGHPLKMRVSRAVFQQKGEAYQPKQKKTKQDKQFETAKKRHILSWNEGMDDGRGLRIIIIKNMFLTSEFDIPNKEQALAEFEQEVREECEKFGDVEKVTVFDRHPQGPVAIKFKESAAAEMCLETMNGRWFAARQLEAEFFDGKTDYRMKDQEGTDEDDRLKEFEKWIETGGDASHPPPSTESTTSHKKKPAQQQQQHNGHDVDGDDDDDSDDDDNKPAAKKHKTNALSS